MQTEKNIWLRMLSMILTLALLISCVPNQVYAMAGEALADLLEATDTATLQPNATPDPVLSTARIVAEDASRRGKTYKEYIMNNGLRLATVYPSAIHYEENGEWKDIDNTLVAAISGGKAVYQNTAGAWSVRFPQSLSSSDMIGITKDGHTVQFGMAGEMRSTGDLVVASVGQIGATADTLAVSNAQTAVAQIQGIDLTDARAAAEHPETVLDKLNSRLTYANVYPNTNVVYDLQGNQLKESVVLQRYDASLWGYRYILETGDLIPVLREDQCIDLCHPDTDEVILTMPAPYMLDNNGETNYDVEVSLTRNGSKYLLSYYLPRAWLADSDRAWPVILDPVISMYGDYYNLKDCTVFENGSESYTDFTLECGHNSTRGVMRFFMEFTELPPLTPADVVVDAKLSLRKPTNGNLDTVIEVHKVTAPWTSQTITWNNKPNCDATIEDYVICKLAGQYTWNITNLVREWYDGDNHGIMFKASDEIEAARNGNWKQFYSSDSGPTATYLPMLTIIRQNHNGLEDYWSYSSSSAGRAGTGYVNLFTGNLVWVRNDLGFDGNRMPVSISHIYNSNDSQTNQFGMGYGWRTNYNQTIARPDPNTVSEDNIFVWEDGDGTRHYFYPAEDSEGNEISNTYLDEDGLHLTLTTNGSEEQKYQLTDQLGNKSYFDATGRLRKIESNQQVKSNIEITYTADNLINTIEDGVDRVYQFHYQSNLLSKISYKGSGNTELTYVLYTYDEVGKLVSVEDKKPYEESEAFITTFDYGDNNLLTKATDVTGYNIIYTYHADSTNRIDFVREYNGTTLGQFISFEYGTRYTKSIDHKAHETYYQFNDWGNVVAVHDSAGHTQYTKYALNDVNDSVPNTAEPHQVVEVFEQGGATNNTLWNSSFEDTSLWDNENATTSTRTLSEKYKYQGQYSLKMTEGEEGIRTDISLNSTDVEAGETYTFSAYIYLETGSEVLVKLGFDDTKVSKTAKDTKGQWVRVQVSYTNEGTEVESIHPTIELVSGTAYIDCVQFEKADSASDYCMMPNGDVRLSTVDNILSFPGWKTMDGQSASDFYFEGDSPNSALKGGVLRIIGETAEEKYITQSVAGGGKMGDIFVLSGWAMANAAPLREYRQSGWEEDRVEMREFGLKLIFHHEGGTSTEHYVSFDPNIAGDRWQYVAATIVATAPYTKVSVQVVYSHQVNVAYFDGIQLYKNRCSTTYAYDGNKNLIRETNILGQTTTYGYEENNKVDLASITPAAGAAVTYGYDQYHNVTSMVEKVTVPNVTPTTIYTTTYGYVYDAYGNVTSITVTQEEKIGDQINTLQQKSWTAYTDDGNYVTSTTNTYNETTYYGYNFDTGVLEWVKYPGDTDATRTNYSYDGMYRLIGTSAAPDQNTQMSATYTYHKDLLATITTGSNTTYTITYGDYNLRKSVQVGSRVLATYFYSNENENASDNEKRNHNLERLDYGNGDRVEYTYDYLGRVTSAKYHEYGEASISRVINYVYDNAGALAYMTDSATGIETRCSYDKTSRTATVEETDGESFYHAYRYFYDDKGNITGAQECIRFADNKDSTGQGNAVLYEYLNQYLYLYDYKNRLASVLTSKTQKDYAYDGLDRLTEETVVHVEGNTSTPILSNRYTYEDITVIENVTVSEYTGSRVSKVETEFDDVTKVYRYTYDDNGNITSISDGTHTTTYEYDAANQLTRENNQAAGKTWRWTYDNAGNILSKEEFADTIGTLGNDSDPIEYVYNDTSWGDLLTSYNGKTFLYDGSGNLTNDGTWAYTWRQGRQLATMSLVNEDDPAKVWEFTYDANGMRTKRSYGDKVYTYVYSGSQLTAMTYSSHKFLFTYDAAGKPLTLEYHDTFDCQAHTGGSCGSSCKTYYYVTNLQGDVIALLDSSGNVKAEYAYDAWGNHVETPSSFIGNYNPLRYRGYVYDRETKLYYLQSRYYNPEIGRFISADSFTSTGQGLLGNNMFAYCLNNPIMNYDPSGHIAITSLLVGLAVTSLITWGASQLLGEQVVGGASSMVNGGSAIYTGVGLLSFGPVGWVAGGALILVGGATMLWGANEIVAGISGTNYLQEVGMSASLYDGLYTGLNIASSLGTTAGNIYMGYANTSGKSNPGRKGKPLSRYSTIDDAGIKQYRFFDSAGDAWYDLDFRHGGNHKFPHYHGWVNGSRIDDHWTFAELIRWLFTGGN